jgi:hypothetical protein
MHDHDDQRRTQTISSYSFATLQNLNVRLISEFGQYKFLTQGDAINSLLGFVKASAL